MLYKYTLSVGYIAPGEIFENLLQLKRFGLYFEGIPNRSQKIALFIYRCNDISYRDAKRFVGMLPEKFWIDWCCLVQYWCTILIRFSLKKVPLFIIKNVDYSYTPGYTLAMGNLFCSMRNVRKHALVDSFLSYFA